ncbi:hypothetical protein D3C76_1397510 [compost metagenome]
MQPSSQQFLGSLPVRRKILVLSKYASACCLLILAGILCGLVNSVARYFMDGNMYFNTWLVVGSILSGLLFMALYIPLFYWIGPKGGQFLNIILILIVMMGNGVLTGILSSRQSITLISWLVSHPVESGLIGGGIFIVAMLISFVISTAIFKKRDI